MRANLRYVGHVLFHPFDGFWDVKHEKRGSYLFGFLSLFLWAFSQVIEQEVTSFLFNVSTMLLANIGRELMKVAVITVLFCVGNWSITTLMDGEGRFRDIFLVFSYAVVPLWLIRIPLAFFSLIFSYSELVYYTTFQALAVIWFFFLLFAGILTTHQYTVVKMMITAVLTVVAMMILVFIYLLFFRLISEFFSFVMAIYQELSFRM